MKIYYWIPFLCFWIACQEQTTVEPSSQQIIPPALRKVLNHHGYLSHWRKKQIAWFKIQKEDGDEWHLVDLKDRRDRIMGTDFEMGFDGEQVWVQADSTFPGDPRFYHNLYFYFFAMPFVLADPGAHFEEVPSIDCNGQNFPGFKVSFADSIGTSPKDEYFIHYDPRTYTLKWLGYTMTYFDQSPSDQIHWVNYSNWKHLEKLYLPQTLTWYKRNNGVFEELDQVVTFKEVEFRSRMNCEDDFAMPDGAIVIP